MCLLVSKTRIEREKENKAEEKKEVKTKKVLFSDSASKILNQNKVLKFISIMRTHTWILDPIAQIDIPI